MDRRHFIVGLVALGLCGFAPAASVRVIGGNVVLTVGGASRTITRGGQVIAAAVSTDARSVAWVSTAARSGVQGSSNPTNLYHYDVASGRTQLLLESREADEPQRNLRSFSEPTFSLDGGFVYVVAEAWTTSGAIHQINIRTRAHRFVTAGSSVLVIRNGPYRGYLLVEKHKYRDPPEGGSYNPTYVVRPDARESFIVPGTGVGDYGGNGAVGRWLAQNGWTAS